jgi:dephospho-CoA kinase
MLIAGLTGGIGAGKSTVAAMLADRGATVIDVDVVGRRVLEPDGAIDRAALARIVFADAEALGRLTAISHPAINEELVARLASLPNDAIVVLDMAVLAESELGRSDPTYRYTFVATVEASPELREDRAVARGSERADVRRRMAQQATDEQRRSIADVVLTNDGSAEDLTAQVDGLWGRLQVLASQR